jgi:hypothetical protein
MKKSYFFKFFVFALVGALAILPSCKDYDDDISGLETSVSTVKSDLTALQSSVSSAQSAATAAQSTATDALAKANEALAAAQAAGDAEAIAALETQVEGLVAQIADINEELEALAGLEARVEALMAELEAANEAQLEAIIADIAGMSEELQGMVGDMVTAVKLYGAAPALKFSTINEKENVFAEGIANAITFVKDKQIQSLQTLVIQVSPANAEITPEMVTLQNSKGIAYDNIEIVSVKPYNQLLTRSTDGSGLWEVTVRLKEYVKTDFEAATIVKGTPDKKVLFAVAINNTTTEANPLIRKVTTDYDVTLESVPAPAMENVLNYFVNDKNVSTINNRYGVAGGVAEYAWSGAAAVKGIKPGDTGANTEDDDSDDRTGEALYPAVQGKAIKIALTNSADDTYDKIAKPANVRAIYVTLDKGNAVESAPSELNAWNSYTYTGLNTVVEGTETTITVDGATAIDDVIGFRVYAVNVDGTLVDPDGKAFYVSLGTPAGEWPVVATVATPTSETMTNSAEKAVTLSKLATSTKYTYTWTADKAEAYGSPASSPLAAAFNVQFLPATGSALFTTTTGATDVEFIAPDFSTVKKIVAVPTEDSWLAYKDGKVYSGTLTIKNATGHVLTTLNVSFKKELPTAAPTGFSAKSGQIVNGVYNAYLVPTIDGLSAAWTAPNATNGMMKLEDVFNFTGNATGKDANFKFSFAASEEDDDDKVVPATADGNGSIVVDKKFIDNTTKHATTVSYDYGLISTETKKDGKPTNYIISDVMSFQTVYNNIYNSTYSWKWATRAELAKATGDDDWLVTDATKANYKTMQSQTIEYGTAAPTIDLNSIYGVSTYNKDFNALLGDSYEGSLQLIKAKLVSNSNGLEEYFEAGTIVDGKVTLTPKSGATNPTIDVPSTLQIEVKDMYNNEKTIEVPMTVLKK